MKLSGALALAVVVCMAPVQSGIAGQPDPAATSSLTSNDVNREGAKPPLSSGLDFGHGLKYQTGNGNFKIGLNAALQVDTAVFSPDRTELNDDLAVRRAQFAVSGSLYQDLSYGAVIDVTTGDASIQDALVRYSGWQPAHFTLGQFKQPFSLEWLTTSRNITFLERGLPNVFVPSYHLGFAIDSHGPNWSATASVFENDIDGTRVDGEGWGGAARLTFAPIATKTRALHFGMATVYRDLDDDTDRLRFRIRPEARLSNVRLVDTRNLSRVDGYVLAGLEAAAVFGPLSVQAEYMRNFVDRKGNRTDPEFDGWYAYASWFLTGESRRYVQEQGRFDRIRPNGPLTTSGGIGAWEVAARYSALDLNDGTIHGGSEDNWTLAFNWYPTAYTRLMANYIFVNSNRQRLGVPREDDPMIFELRFQIEF
jgi:phosphate-selective porin OprO and OprP